MILYYIYDIVCVITVFRITNTILSKTSIRVEWTYPHEDEGNVFIFSATAMYQGPCNIESTHEKEWTASPARRAVTVYNLREFSEYSVTVKFIHDTSRATVSALPVVVSTLPSGIR